MCDLVGSVTPWTSGAESGGDSEVTGSSDVCNNEEPFFSVF